MTRIVHMSDLHFGRDRPELLGPLIRAVNGARADLVAVSGDLTQRALGQQFQAAAAFLKNIEAPTLVVPGNHDVPVHLPVSRFVRPFHQYRKWINRDLAPVAHLPGLNVIGLNTVDPWRWQRGRIRSAAVRRACAICAEAETGDLNILVGHHPFEHRPGSGKAPMRGAEKALRRLSDCGADVILSGHLHLWLAEPFLTRPFGAGMLQIHAGTGLSTRHRGEPNDFAVIDREGDDLLITRWAATPSGNGFAPMSEQKFRRGGDGWRGVGTRAEADPRCEVTA
ncbi:hypothetical protein GLS40_05075 [Pseudooceanicola sp. 216_PA32_1]|uniref:Calcineurin-like phosphoesterase domain-containing protein n=1 Tax=Pseudooceanicola pacificus TaxID=2676438 RepID=A0A844WEF9_9RHOB|nr:metallophosphoesterase [Pseudooceanicola pacificus]MWB77389.1 hypothetical protein [Pseudooceanicola pacificus]